MLSRFSAVSGVLLGLSIAVPGAIEAFTGETASTSLVLGIGAAFGAPALLGFHELQRERSGRFGAFAFAVNLVGLGLFTGVAFTLNVTLFFLDGVTVPTTTKAVLLGSAVVFVVGTVLFGASMVRAKVFPALPSWGYLVALSLIAVLAPLPDSVWTSALHVLGGASLVWLSAVRWARP
ncbi:hypothetical protein FKR81_02965 [Lentzea tibetensis]|uniref:DUF998 domain-containing protein n=1 Tax=Lentzea tibetensis TaxID=2591470 RepID=A0A563F317_9PSEU|nr:hypothetical protein [Lentzea tibetensis]TWP53734.1 hypothetical protein FKR81_02965 [Lentzea tibetensis]